MKMFVKGLSYYAFICENIGVVVASHTHFMTLRVDPLLKSVGIASDLYMFTNQYL